MSATSPSVPANPMQALRRHIAALATLPESVEPVISAYFDLRSSALRSEFPIWATAARNTLPRESRAFFDKARADVEAALNQSWPAAVQSLAVFSRAGDHPLLMVLPFGAPVEIHFAVSSRPAIFPLVQMKDRFHRFVVVICTEDSGRIFEVTLGSVSEEILATRPESRQQIGRQWSREHFHHRRQEDNRRFVSEKVNIITNLMARRGLNHLILAGHPRHIAPVRDRLPKHLQARVVGAVLQSPDGHDHSPVLERAIDAFVEAEQNESRNTVERLHEQVRRRGLAVVGIHASRRAIESGAAAELVISEELPHADREDLVRLATAHDLPIEVCEEDEVLQSHGGVGCLLRFRMEFLHGAGIPVPVP